MWVRLLLCVLRLTAYALGAGADRTLETQYF